MSDSNFQWLLAQLPAWQASGKIDGAAAERIRARCNQELRRLGQNTSTSMPIAIAALLLISTVWIVLDFWGWQGFSLPVRWVLAILPWLATSIALVWAHKHIRSATSSRDTREACALLHGFGSALTLGLLSTLSAFGEGFQSTATYLTAWLVMQLPLLPLTRSVVMTFATLLVFVINYRFLDFNLVAFWALFLPWSVFAVFQLRWLRTELPRLAIVLLWVFIVNLIISLTLELLVTDLDFSAMHGSFEKWDIVFQRALPALLTMLFFCSALIGFGRIYLTGFASHFNFRISSRPFEVVGGALCVVTLGVLQSSGAWRIISTLYFSENSDVLELITTLPGNGLVLMTLAVLTSLYIFYRLLRRKDYRVLPFILIPWLVFAGIIWTSLDLPIQVLAGAIKLYLTFAIGAWMVALGTMTGRYIILDAGMFVLLVSAILIALSTRSLDAVEQALILTVTATALLAAHFGYLRKKITARNYRE